MKKIILFIILSMLVTPDAGASEIFGQISTNPNALTDGSNPPPEIQPAPPPAVPNVPAAIILPSQIVQSIPNQLENRPKEIKSPALKTAPKPEVLGIKIYPDGSLLRDTDQKIYLIEGQVKKHIINLTELEKYRGRAIVRAAAGELLNYQSRGHLDGELIRQRGEVKIYVIKKGVKQHILNLEELRAHYFGLEIFNISREQMAWY